MVVQAVARDGASVVVIDSLSGYLSAMPEERFLTSHLHELLTYLSHRNVVTILTLAQHGILGAQLNSPLDISYLADTVLLLRYFEAFGAVRRAISVVKKRTGPHEVLVRELERGRDRAPHRAAAGRLRGCAHRQPAVHRRAGRPLEGPHVNEGRVVVWAPGRDGRLTCDVLRERGFPCLLTRAWSDVLFALQGGVGTLLIAGELLTSDVVASLERFLGAQPPWSDLPIIVVGADGEDLSAPHPLQALGNVSLLPRPLVLPTLASTVQAALRARNRQYQMRDLLQQRDEAAQRKDEFLAMLAHELRNPLAPLRTGLQVLRLSPSATMAERMHHLMERQLTNVTRLVDDLLDVSRLTRGVVTLKCRPLDVREAVHQACEAAGAAAREKGLELVRFVPDAPLVVQADPVRLDQMIGNLLTNAIRFTPHGGRVEVEATRIDNTVRVRVRDNGQGIARDQVARVFDLFAQSERPIDRGQGGLGIGLTVVRSLATLHGGSASITSEGEGRGTEATITLPLHEGLVTTPAAPAARRCDGAKRRVVIIEDNADAAEALSAYLQRIGHDVTVARDGHAGLDAVERHRPHVVICDIGLPELDGYEVARRLLAQGVPHRCVLIAVTGYGDVVDRARTLAAGFSHHLTKPADPELLARLVEQSDAACA